MKRIVSIYNNKGGVGKSSSTIVLSHMISQNFGKRVLMIDCDPQGNLSNVFDLRENMVEDLRKSVMNLRCLLTGAVEMNQDKKEIYLEDLLIDGSIDIHKAIRKTKYEGLDIIPCTIRLAEIEEQLKADIRTPQQFRIKTHLDGISDEYDYVLLDLSPSVSIININALASSTDMFIPIRAEKWSLDGAANALRLMNTVRLYNPFLEFSGFFITALENKSVTKVYQELISNGLSEWVLPYQIKKSKLIEEMIIQKVPLLEWDSKKVKDKVTRRYLEFAEYIIAPAAERDNVLKKHVAGMQEEEKAEQKAREERKRMRGEKQNGSI